MNILTIQIAQVVILLAITMVYIYNYSTAKRIYTPIGASVIVTLLWAVTAISIIGIYKTL